jgi:DnaA family protein
MLDGLETVQLLCVDDVQCACGEEPWEHALFNLFNGIRDSGGRMLVSATRPAARLPFELADLRSRLGWGLTCKLTELGDADKVQALLLSARRRGIPLSMEVAQYILSRCPRDLATLFQILDRLDQASLSAKRRLTIPFLREHLNATGPVP